MMDLGNFNPLNPFGGQGGGAGQPQIRANMNPMQNSWEGDKFKMGFPPPRTPPPHTAPGPGAVGPPQMGGGGQAPGAFNPFMMGADHLGLNLPQMQGGVRTAPQSFSGQGGQMGGGVGNLPLIQQRALQIGGGFDARANPFLEMMRAR